MLAVQSGRAKAMGASTAIAAATALWVLIACAVEAASPPDFQLVPNSATVEIPQGASGSNVITVEGMHSYDGPDITVSVGSAPVGVTGACVPPVVHPTAVCTLSILVPAAVPAGAYTVRVDGTNGTDLRSATFTLNVLSAPSVLVQVNQTALSLRAGTSANLTVNVTPSGPARGPLNLTAVNVPAGVVGSFDPRALPPGGGAATLSLSAATTASVGDFTFAVNASDGTNGGESPVSLRVLAAPEGPTGSTVPNDLPLWLVGLVAIGVGGAAVAIRLRRGRALPAPLAAPGSRKQFVVEEVFLLYGDGRTMLSRAAATADGGSDPEVIGSMLIAVQDFIRDSFRKGAAVDRMTYGDNSILLERGAYIILALTVFGEPPASFRDQMAEAVRRVEGTYAGIIETWDGSRTSLEGVEALLAPLLQSTQGVTREDVVLATTTHEVQTLSGVEFFQGFVRLKAAVVNHTAATITGVTVEVEFNADVLRLHKVEPATYRASGSRVLLGTLKPGEKVSVAYYFDPQICSTSLLEGTCRYDCEGKAHVVKLKSRSADVVCPLFFTKEQANTAMLRRLIETELNQFDIKAYSFRAGASADELRGLFEALTSSVASHDVVVVRSTQTNHPFVGEAWFYGKTQVKGFHVVVRAVVSAERQRAEFFVASVSMRTVTGLLAELNHTLTRSLPARLGSLEVTALFGTTAREDYASATLVSQMVEGEMAAGESDA